MIGKTEIKTNISPTALIDPSAQLGKNIYVGPYAIIEKEVIIGDGTRIDAHAHIKPFTIVGNGKQTRDFVHVSDLVRAILKAASSKKIGEIYNVAGGKEITVNKIAKLIGGYKVSVPKRPGEPNRSLADISKIKAHLNWEPKISIDQGIRLLLKNISNWKEAPVWTPNSIKKATKTWFKLLSKS